MDESQPPPLPVTSGEQPSAPQPPVEPSDAGYPVASIAPPSIPEPEIPYATPAFVGAFIHARAVARRPGLVTAIGVVGIIVALLSGLASLIGAGMTFSVYSVSKSIARFNAMNTNAMMTINATMAQGINVANSPMNPLSVADSGVVSAVMTDKLSLDGAQLRELTELLHKHGGSIFITDGGAPLTAVSVREAITDSQNADSPESFARFVTAQGTVKIFTDHATFESADGAATFKTSAQNQTDTMQFGTSNLSVTQPAMPGAALAPNEIGQIITAIRQTPGVVLTPMHVATIQQELAKPNQTLVIRGGTMPFTAATPLPNNAMQINFNSGVLILDASGKISSSVTTAGQVNPTSTVPGTWVAAVVFECLASALLAIYLFIVAIITLRGSLLSPRLLCIFAALKIPLAIFACVSVTQLIFQSSRGNTNPMTLNDEIFAYLFGAGLLATGIVYPVGLLVALRAAEVRLYFSASEANRF